MSKLLRSNFSRLKGSRSFWLGIAVMVGFAVLICLKQYGDKVNYDTARHLDTAFFAPYIIVGILEAIFCSIFIGTEYSDGTIRNKLIIGHKRNHIYLSDFIVCAAAGLFMTLAYLIVVCALGIPLLGFVQLSLPLTLLLTLGGIMLSVALAAIFNLVALLNQNKAIVAIISTVGIFLAITLTTYMYSRMQAPEMMEAYSMTINGAVEKSESTPNPDYLNDSQRAVYQTVLDILPTGQAFEIAVQDTPNPGLLPLYSAGIILLTNTAGLLCFRKKDLK